MRFLFIANTLPNPNEGASGCDISTMTALKDQGHEVRAVWTGEWKRCIRHHNLHQLLELPGWFHKVMVREFEKQAYDVIQISQPHGWLAARTHRAQNFPGVFIIRSHGWEPCAWAAERRFGGDNRPLILQIATKLLRPLLERHNRLVLKYADGVVVSSEEELGYLLSREGVAAAKAMALPPGIPQSYLNSPCTQSFNRFRNVLYVASFSHHKAPEVAASVMKGLAARFLDMKFTWVTQEYAHPAIRALLGPVAERVTLRGWMPREELMELYNTHGIFLQPSHYEGYCIAFLEAMARGCCVAATNISGMAEKIVNGQNGLLFNRSDVESMVGTLADLVANPNKCALMAAAARETVERMTWEQTASSYLAFCEKRLAAKRLQ